MARSNLTTRFFTSIVNKFQKKYREEHEDCKNKNIARYITTDVINRKGIPDIDDVILLIKLGNNNCDDEQAYAILDRWLDNEDNKKRGIAGAFCECCKDYCLDIPVDSLHKEQCDQLEEIIGSRLEMQKKINELMKNVNELIENNKTQKTIEADKGTEEESTQE